MSKARRVGGSGWAGVYGSFVGLSKGSGRGKPRMGNNAKSKRKRTPKKIDLSALPDNEDVRRAAKRVLTVQTEIELAEKRLATLNSQLGAAMDKFQIALNLAQPTKKGVIRKKVRATGSKQ